MRQVEKKKAITEKATIHMDDVLYYGMYSTMIGTTNVSLLTKPQDSARFPPGIFYKDNNYRFIRYYRASTPSQKANLYQWAQDSNIETDIQLTS